MQIFPPLAQAHAELYASLVDEVESADNESSERL